MVFPASGLALLGLGASLVSAIPQAGHIIARPPATLTVTSLIEITNEVTVTACAVLLHLLHISLKLRARHMDFNSVFAYNQYPAEAFYSHQLRQLHHGYPDLLRSIGYRFLNQPYLSLSPGHIFPWHHGLNSATQSDHFSSLARQYHTRTLTLSTGISLTTGTGTGASSVPYPSSSLWSNTTRPIPSTTPGSLTTTEATLPTIPIPTPSDVDTTSAPCTTYGCPSYTTATYTTVINTTVSDQLPETGTASQSKTTLRSTIIVTVTKSLPSSTGTGYSSTSPGTGISTDFPSHTIPTSSIKLSSTLSYPTTTSSSWTNTTTTSSGTSTETTSDDVITSTQSPSSTKKPCTTHKAESSTESSIESSTQSSTYPASSPGTTVSDAKPSAVTTSSSIFGGYDTYPTSSPSTTVSDAKPSAVSPSKSPSSSISGGYDSYPTSTSGTTVSDAKPSLVTPSSSIDGGYDTYPTSSPGTTVSDAKPSLVTPTIMETRTSDEATASSSTSIYGGYDFGHKRRVIRH
ncbi:hypothetical protein K4K57_006209 [Colletotrichum sp. SAR 10_99]|nr:hypothetical protein K4K57_006209 [Colletotrichum sp. SAR 10_99]